MEAGKWRKGGVSANESKAQRNLQRGSVCGLSSGSRTFSPGLSLPAIVVVAMFSLILPPLLMWFAKPLQASRAYRLDHHPSEDTFRYIGPEGPRRKQELFPFPSDPPVKTLSVVVPAHNEEDRLPGMMQTTLDFLEDKSRNDSSFSFEMIVVDDGSTDKTSDVVNRWTEQLGSDAVRLLTLQSNQGKGAAVRKGMLRMRGQYALMADADAATDIRDLHNLLSRMEDIEVLVGDGQRYGMVVGSRAHMEGEAIAKRALHRTILMYLFHGCCSILCTRKIKDTQCGFKLFTRDTALAVFSSLHLDRWAFDTEVIFISQLLNIPMEEVAVNWHEVDGSKLIRSKLDVVVTSAAMLRDMICVKLCYTLGIWKVAPEASPLLQ